MNEIIKDNDFYFFKCPHCDQEIVVQINELNCKIFRHAIYKSNYQQVDPHLNKQQCDNLLLSNLVYGCCKPFEIIEKENKLYSIKCEYK
jgi:hypothetical protein